MVAAFLVIGLGLLAVAGIVWQNDGGRLRRAALALAYLFAGVGMIVAGLVPTEPGAVSTAEIVHSRASAAGSLLIVVAAVATAWLPGGDAALPRRLLSATVAALAVLSVALHETAVSGLSQRALWAAILAWLLSIAFARA